MRSAGRAPEGSRLGGRADQDHESVRRLSSVRDSGVRIYSTGEERPWARASLGRESSTPQTRAAEIVLRA